MIAFADVKKAFDEVARMPLSPCGLMVHPQDYGKFRKVLDEVTPSEPGPFTPVIPVEVSQMGKVGEVVVFYDRALFAAFCELNRPTCREEEEAPTDET